MPSIRNSAHWMPDIEKLGKGFLLASLTESVVKCRKDAFSEIDDYCDKKVEEVKNEVYCNLVLKSDCLLDRHKIAAIHIIAVLKKQPFATYVQPSNTNFVDMLPNEHYALLLLSAILKGWYKKIYGKKVQIDLPATYKDNLILLFNKYRKSQSSSTIDNMFAYSLANIAYLVEERYLGPS